MIESYIFDFVILLKQNLMAIGSPIGLCSLTIWAQVSYLLPEVLSYYLLFDPLKDLFQALIVIVSIFSREFDAHKVFPESVFQPGGLILPPQLREAYAILGIYMTDEDYDKLWKR